MRRRLARLWVVATLFLPACSAAAPTPRQQADVVAYELELQRCIADAKLVDAGHEQRVLDYRVCADRLDAEHGRADGGAR